nr:hypothetical protein [Tanacetum cinerariifolium]
MDASGGSGRNSHVWLIVDENGAVDMNDMMDNLEERITNLEMVFAYLKNKKMLERQENKLKKETPSSDGRTSEDIVEFEVASKSTSSTFKPKKVTTHKVVTQKVQTKAFLVKSPVPINNYILGLAAAYTWACTGNKTFGTRKQNDAIVAGQARKGKKKQDDIGSTEFTIYEMMKESSVWSVRKVVKYNLISNTNTEIFDIGSNQMVDDDDDDADNDDDAVLFIPPYEVDPNLYEFIPSLTSV